MLVLLLVHIVRPADRPRIAYVLPERSMKRGHCSKGRRQSVGNKKANRPPGKANIMAPVLQSGIFAVVVISINFNNIKLWHWHGRINWDGIY